jgi:hypothetical protein
MICIHTTFYLPSSNGSLVIGFKLKTKSNIAQLPCYFFLYVTQKTKMGVSVEEIQNPDTLPLVKREVAEQSRPCG